MNLMATLVAMAMVVSVDADALKVIAEHAGGSSKALVAN